MSEELLIQQCSPTLAGLKTANLFSCSYTDETELKQCIRCWNKRFVKKGLRIIPVRFQNGRALIYVYRPSKLDKDLQHDIAERLLTERGYCMKTSEHCIFQLINRLYESEEFPHEIGLFLGYPPEEVDAFIVNRSENCKCIGCWRVYGDVEASQKMFKKFKKCTSVYLDQFKKGRTVDKLTVAG